MSCVVCCTFLLINSGIDHPECKDLYRHVKNLIARKWFDVGVELFDKDDITQLDTIEASHPGDAEACCKKMLKLWVEKYPEATWNDLIKSLKARGVELCDTASKIEGMLLPPGRGMFINSNCHIYIFYAYWCITYIFI